MIGLLLAAPKSVRKGVVTVPGAMVRVIDERCAGLFFDALRDHVGSLDRAIASAIRQAYLQGYADGINRPEIAEGATE